ncbi:amidase [Rhodococcus jostii]|uniref:Aspartyl-tRNA(Asn)/glutamyl-tRNA(Gln) amidotransferase subunit A n=1 Tax=Rhodococcus jostii TaxID=132919 RepID=A0A1H5FBM6_RHOJO|nr:amidase [Rhodococcus jostii]SEE00733.1 aspartyl-tRNA(Asn)/glutamyl-tRNA(Gln) amidotransferase subunit A [Rhodococcus jostii]
MTDQTVACHSMSVAELNEAFSSGSLTPLEALESTLARIAAKDDTHRAIYVIDTDEARASAQRSGERWRSGTALGPLDGVPVTIKENTAKVGLPQSYGTAAREPVIATENSPVVDRLLEAGAVVVASTSMPDFSGIGSGVSSRHGITRNAWNPAWNTGGSSSGSAVAAALGYAPVNIGTDIGGSIRVPAAMNAAFGFKPSYGRVPIQDTYLGRCAGPITRTVRDAAHTMAFLSRHDARDYSALPAEPIDWTDLDIDIRGLRIGINFAPVEGKSVDPEIIAAVQQAAAVFESGGAHVEALDPYLSQDYLSTAFLPFFTAHLWAQMNDKTIVDDLTKANQEMVTAVSSIDSLSSLELMRAYDSIGPFVQETADMLGRYDAVLSPTTGILTGPAESPMISEFAGAANFTSAFNAAGTPAASINCGFSNDGKPIGLQVAADRRQDLTVLQVAAWYEAHRGPEATPDWSTLD